MNIAFLHRDGYAADELFEQLKERLATHDLTSWEAEREAPSRDLDMILVQGALGRERMTQQSKLALVQTTSAGYEGIDIAAATELGIWVSSAPSGETGNAVSVAEFAVLLMLGTARHLTEELAIVHDGSTELRTTNVALSGKVVCIVGLGGIGRMLVDRLRAFGMRILATDEHPGHAPAGVMCYRADRLHDAIATADFVVLCAPATKENLNLIDARALDAMKAGAVLVNVARGMLVDEAALANSLERGHIRAAGLDVLKTEPADPANPLLAFPQVLVTPHIAGNTDIMLRGTVRYIGTVVDDVAAGRKPASLLNAPGKPRRELQATA
jgi:phosphoglycerate dehydrogenase-like enzyme